MGADSEGSCVGPELIEATRVPSGLAARREVSVNADGMSTTWPVCSASAMAWAMGSSEPVARAILGAPMTANRLKARAASARKAA